MLPTIDPSNQTKIITSFIQDTFKNAHKTTAVVAVSGGIDSATTLTLTTQALGAKNVHTILLPSDQTDPVHTQDALDLCQHLNIPKLNTHQVNISEIQSSFQKALIPNPESPTPARTGNIAARIRMIAIYDLAKSLDALVVGTENHSEHLLGYFTRFGDEASDLEPIKHLYKTQLYELAKHLGIPQKFLKKPPTAGLWDQQTDESELGFSYQDADPILYLHSEKHLTPEEITDKGFDKDLVNKVITHVNSVEFKHHVPYHL